VGAIRTKSSSTHLNMKVNYVLQCTTSTIA